VFITRATRHDLGDVEELLRSQGWEHGELKNGRTLVAREGAAIGCVRLIEVAPNTVIVDDMVVREDKRGQGIGKQLMQAAMNSRGGKLYLCCHTEQIAFYERFEFNQVQPETLPEPVANYFDETGDLTPPEGHEHFFLTAR
jgi:N-acetylglutamate synthase-like GNAT family acetyltransferase